MIGSRRRAPRSPLYQSKLAHPGESSTVAPGCGELGRPVDGLGEVCDDLDDGDRGERGGDAIGGVADRDDRVDAGGVGGHRGQVEALVAARRR